MSNLKFALFQFNPIVGALDYNTNQLIAAIKLAKANGVDIFVSSELAICGYPPEDLVFRKSFRNQVMSKLTDFLGITGITMLIGTIFCTEDGKCFNSVVVIRDGQILDRADKVYLPNYSVFDEMRYFASGDKAKLIDCNGTKVGILICEDTWHQQLARECKEQGAQILCSINASPFYINKYHERISTTKLRVMETGLPLIYVNQVGGQDELIFDGGSFVLDHSGNLIKQFPSFQAQLDYIDYVNGYFETKPMANYYPPDIESVYQGLVLAIRDYVNKNNFKKVMLGLSGGIDSALVLTIAVDALGSENVLAVMMPSKYTAEISLIDAKELASNLGVAYKEIAISPIYDSFASSLAPIFANLSHDLTEENLQARIRGMLLMAISNKLGYLVLATSNKSEQATGYATLYGDMAGGFAVLKDVPKTLVYKLSNWRNEKKHIIPERIITRAPTAELRENQTDQDSLPDYPTLDTIIELLIIEGLSSTEIIAKGYDGEIVSKVANLIKINEYKRFQAPVGPKITKIGFTKDWRYPITNHFKL